MELTFTLFNICMALSKTLLNKLCLKLMHQVQMVMFPFICRKYPTGLESLGYEPFKDNLSGVNYVQETYYSINFWGVGSAGFHLQWPHTRPSEASSTALRDREHLSDRSL